MQVIIRDLRKEFGKGRPPEVYGKSYSCVLYGKCNFRCKFCFEEGDKADYKGVLPNSKLMNYSLVEDWVTTEAKKGIPIKITGGEPILFPDSTIRLLEAAKKYDAYTQLDTNGSIPQIAKEFARHLNAIGLDIKGNESNIEYLTGVSKELSLYKPLETLELSKDFPCLVEFKTVMFDFTDLKFLEWLFEKIPENAYWEWKQYRPFEGVDRIPKKVNLVPASQEQILSLMKKMCERHSDLKKRMVAIIGSSKDYKNFHYPRDLSL